MYCSVCYPCGGVNEWIALAKVVQIKCLRCIIRERLLTGLKSCHGACIHAEVLCHTSNIITARRCLGVLFQFFFTWLGRRRFYFRFRRWSQFFLLLLLLLLLKFLQATLMRLAVVMLPRLLLRVEGDVARCAAYWSTGFERHEVLKSQPIKRTWLDMLRPKRNIDRFIELILTIQAGPEISHLQLINKSYPNLNRSVRLDFHQIWMAMKYNNNVIYY